MAKPLIIRPEAEIDIAESALWYEGERPGLGVEFIDEVELIFDRIVLNPLRYAEVEQRVRRALLNRFPFGVYFMLEDEQITVLSVLHFRRNPEVWKNRM